MRIDRSNKKRNNLRWMNFFGINLKYFQSFAKIVLPLFLLSFSFGYPSPLKDENHGQHCLKLNLQGDGLHVRNLEPSLISGKEYNKHPAWCDSSNCFETIYQFIQNSVDLHQNRTAVFCTCFQSRAPPAGLSRYFSA